MSNENVRDERRDGLDGVPFTPAHMGGSFDAPRAHLLPLPLVGSVQTKRFFMGGHTGFAVKSMGTSLAFSVEKDDGPFIPLVPGMTFNTYPKPIREIWFRWLGAAEILFTRSWPGTGFGGIPLYGPGVNAPVSIDWERYQDATLSAFTRSRFLGVTGNQAVGAALGAGTITPSFALLSGQGTLAAGASGSIDLRISDPTFATERLLLLSMSRGPAPAGPGTTYVFDVMTPFPFPTKTGTDAPDVVSVNASPLWTALNVRVMVMGAFLP